MSKELKEIISPEGIDMYVKVESLRNTVSK